MKYFIISLLTFSCLFGEEFENNIPFADIERGLPTLVGNCVNVITGDYVENGLDLKIRGPNPLTFERFYSSSDYDTHSLFWGWRHNHDSSITLKKNKDFACYIERSGRTAVYQNGRFCKERSGRGFTNCGSGKISARNSLKNTFLSPIGEGVRAVSGSGTIRDFKGDLLKQEVLPNGNQTLYHYDSEGVLSRITSTNSTNTPFSEIELKRVGPSLIVSSSDGREITYHLKRFRERTPYEKKVGQEPLFHVTEVVPSDGPSIKYEYAKLKDVNNEHICKRSLPDQRTRLITYYEGGRGRNKVKTIASPVGLDSTPIITHTFRYENNKTFVFDAEGHQTEYTCDQNKRLKRIDRYLNRTPYSSEKFVWNDFGELLDHTLSDNNVKKVITFTYDSFGNILTETTTGDQSYTKTYTYSDKHELTSQREDNGLETKYAYDKKQRLLSKEILCHNQAIKKHSYAYDANSVLIEERVEGDGVKRITSITPTKKIPIGLPKVIEEKFLTPEGKEQLISKVVKRYSKVGELLKEEHYDSTNTHRYTLKWEYDAHGNVTSETNALGRTIHRTYDDNDNLISEEWPTHQKTYAYDFSNRRIKETILFDNHALATSHRYNTLNQLIATIDPYGNETEYKYDDLGRLVETVYPATPTPDGTLNKTSIKEEYDIFNHVTLHTDQRGESIKKTLNIHGKPQQIEYPDGTKESFVYNPDGTLKQTTHKNGQTTLYTRDPLHRLTKEKSGSTTKTYTYNAFHLTSETDPEGVATKYHYDGAGRLISRSKADSLITYEYDPLGRLHKTTEGDTITIKEYDLLDQLIEERIEDNKGNIYRKVGYAYDSNGNKTHEITPDGETVTEYNPLGEPVKITDPMGHVTQFSYEYSPVKRVIKTDPSGIQTLTTLNALNQESLIKIRDPFGKRLSKTELFYDPLGNICLQREKAIETKWEYNSSNQLIQLTEALGTPDQKITRYSYNSFGEKETLIKPDGTTIHYQYDDKGRLKLLTSSDETISYRYTYNHNGLVTKVEDLIQNTTTEKTRDPLGRVIKEKLGNGLSIERKYDTRGRVVSTKLPDGSFIRYAYDPINLQKVTRLSPEEKELYAEEIQSDLKGNPSLKKLPGKAGTLTLTHDPLNRLTSLSHPALNQSAEYNPAGNLNKLTVNNIPKDYTYDYLNQLTKEPLHTYAHDSLYNRISKDGNPYKINALNQVLHDGNTSYRYDLCGRLTEIRSPTETTHLSYDALDRLIKVKGKKEYHYIYDSFGRRLKKNNTHFLYDGPNEIGALDSKTTELRILEPGLHTIAIEKNTQVFATLTDLRGSIAALIDPSTGKLVEEYAYTAFGEELTSGTLSPWRYSSKRTDPETRFVYFGMRYYIPSLGKWLTKDPAGYLDSTNLYQYVFNNPLRYSDPTGEFVVFFPLFTLGAKAAITFSAEAFITAVCAFLTTLGIHQGVQAYNEREKEQQRRQHQRQTDDYYAQKNTNTYAPDRPLPMTEDGVHIPDTDAPHTQLGTRGSKRRPGESYPQAREFDENGKPVRDIDFTDHNEPDKHPNPHQHTWIENPTGGTQQRDKPETVEGWEYD